MWPEPCINSAFLLLFEKGDVLPSYAAAARCKTEVIMFRCSSSKGRIKRAFSRKVSSTCTASDVSRPLGVEEEETVFTVVAYWLLK
jgi:hypothetical protein